MDDEARPGATPVTLPEAVVLRRAGVARRPVLASLGGFAAILALVRARRTEAIDAALTIRWQAFRRPWLGRLMVLVSWPGFPPQSRIIPPILVLGLLLLRQPLEAAFQLLAWMTGGMSELLKGVMKRPRPVAGTDLRVVAAPLGGSSFPSGHVITYVGTYGWLAYVAQSVIRPRWPRRILVASLTALIAAVGPSRIYQGHHWPTDVAASYLLGTAYLLVLVQLYQRIKGNRPIAGAGLRAGAPAEAAPSGPVG
jgi:undecaprenyl-diphosphatase